MLTKHLKALIADAYESEADLVTLIESCFKEIFKEHAAYAFSLFEEDLKSGREWNGCLQGIDYYKQQVCENTTIMETYKKKKSKALENDIKSHTIRET